MQSSKITATSAGVRLAKNVRENVTAQGDDVTLTAYVRVEAPTLGPPNVCKLGGTQAGAAGAMGFPVSSADGLFSIPIEAGEEIWVSGLVPVYVLLIGR